VRIDKLSLAALEATLRLSRDPDRATREIPALAMLSLSEATLAARAERLHAALGDAAVLVRTTGRVGGGALPLLELEGPAVALADAGDPVALAGALRRAPVPVIARVHDGRVVLDPRTLGDDELDAVASAVRAALGR
jgi:L-seryl-tRNA(Ser) seleniumtransferase